MFLFRIIVALVIGLFQWICVIDAFVFLVVCPQVGRPVTPATEILSAPGLLIFAWWTYRMVWRDRRVAR
jgi:hypothetical protein